LETDLEMLRIEKDALQDKLRNQAVQFEQLKSQVLTRDTHCEIYHVKTAYAPHRSDDLL